MIVPNKTLPISETALYRASKLLMVLDKETPVIEIYTKHKKIFTDVADMLDILDLLYILGKIVLSQEKEAVVRVK